MESEGNPLPPRRPLIKRPEKDPTDSLKRGGVLRHSETAKEITGDGERIQRERTMSVRGMRKDLLDALTSGKISREQSVKAHQLLDEALRHYLNQGEMKITIEGVGEVSGKYTIIDINHRFKRGNETQSMRPIVVIAGITNDLASMESTLLALSLSGRPIVMVSYPGSQMGKANGAWIQKQITEKDYALDAYFFKKTIENICGSQDIDMIGYSYGGAVSAEILNDKAFSSRVHNAAFVNPAGMAEHSKSRLLLGLMSESTAVFDPLYVLSIAKEGENNPEEIKQKQLKKQAFDALINKLTKKNDSWKTAKVKKTLLVIHSGKDSITHSVNIAKEQEERALREKGLHMKVETVDNTNHASLLTDPFAMSKEILKRWGDPQPEPVIHTNKLFQYDISDWASESPLVNNHTPLYKSSA